MPGVLDGGVLKQCALVGGLHELAARQRASWWTRARKYALNSSFERSVVLCTLEEGNDKECLRSMRLLAERGAWTLLVA